MSWFWKRYLTWKVMRVVNYKHSPFRAPNER